LQKRFAEKEEKIAKTLESLREESARGTLVLVEGKKDVEALRNLGIEGPILTVKTGGKSFLDVISELEKAEVSEVALLLDFDRRGRQGTSRLKHSLESVGIKTNLEFWISLAGSVGKDLQCVEGLTGYLENLRAKI
jgi:5S rRNA maturation endonuclease (ribonuclease M5)